MVYYHHVINGTPNRHLQMLVKVQKGFARAVDPKLVASHEPMAQRKNVASPSHFLIPAGGPLLILVSSINFLFIMMSMQSVTFLAHLDYEFFTCRMFSLDISKW